MASSSNTMTLTYGSIYLLYYNDFKRDPRDETISINACIVKAPNIDFDGELFAEVL